MVIPTHWSPEQARAVYQLLQTLLQQIDEHYQLLPIRGESPSFDDDLDDAQLDRFESRQPTPTEPLLPDSGPPF